MANSSQYRFKPPHLKLHAVGSDYRHDSSFEVLRPHGSGDWVFVHFTTAIQLRLGKVPEAVQPNACILFAPDQAHQYQGLNGPFSNDWMHFGGDDVPAVLKHYKIPVGKPFYPSRSGFIPVQLTALDAEQIHKHRRWQEAVALQIQGLFLEISRWLSPTASPELSPRMSALEKRMQAARLYVQQNLAEPWSLARMARLVHLSPSRFATLYPAFFGLSPVDDMIQARIQRARWLLTNTSLKMDAVAKDSGFQNTDYFFRVFRKKVGCTPGTYYKNFVSALREQRP